jgi:iron complex outermembrane recepter protein
MGSTLAAFAMSAFAFGAGAPGSPAQASIPPQKEMEAVRTYTIPAGSMAEALSAFADANGFHLLYDTRLTKAMKTAGLSGRYSPEQGLSLLLSGTGLSYRLVLKGRAVSIMLAQNATGTQSDAGAAELPMVEVEANQQGAGGEGAGDPTGTGPGESGGRFTGYNAVTATAAMKDNIPILQTPVAVQVVPRETLDDQQDISIQQALVGNVSSVYQAGSPNVTSFNIRGFFDQQDQVYYNGLSLNNTVNFDTANVQNFQVLKGPAAILYGRVEPGGIIYVETKLPQAIPYFSFEEQAGAFGQTRTTVDATGPLTENKTWLYRLTLDFGQGNSNSFVDFVNSQNLFIAPAITYHPIEQFTLHLNAFYQRNKQVDNSTGDVAPFNLFTNAAGITYGFSLFGGPAPLPPSRYLEDAAFTHYNPVFTQTALANYDWTFDINPNWSVTNRFLYDDQWEFNAFSGPFAFDPSSNAGIGNTIQSDLFTSGPTYNIRSNLDLKGRFDTGPLQHAVLIGTDYLKTDSPVFPFVFFSPPYEINIWNPFYFQSPFSFQNPALYAPGNVNYQVGTNSEMKGVYAQDLISAFGDSLHFLIGGRYDWASSGNGLGPTAAAAEAALTTPLDRAFSPRVGLVYQPVPWLSFYGNYTTSFGLNNGVDVTTHMGLPPQKGLQWEGGAKAEFFDKRLSASMAFYDITKTNVPIAVAGAAGAIFSKVAGSVESKGVEFDVTGRVNENWSLIANFSHDDVRVKQGSSFDPADPTDLVNENFIAGNRFPGVPANAGNLWVKYDALGDFKGLSIGGGLNVIGSMQGDNANSFRLPQYTLVNGMISYRFPWEGAKITAQLNINNITNVTYYPTSTSPFNIVVGAPRAILGSLRVEF